MKLNEHDIELVGKDMVERLKKDLDESYLHISTIFNRSFYEYSVLKSDLASIPSDAVAKALKNITYAIILDKDLGRDISNADYLFDNVAVISDGIYYVIDINYLDKYDYVYNKVYMCVLAAVSKHVERWSFNLPYDYIPKLATSYNMVEIINKGIEWGCKHNPDYNIKATAQMVYNKDDIKVNVLAIYSLKEDDADEH